MKIDRHLPNADKDEAGATNEIARLNKIIGSLMDRAERSTSAQASEFGLFQSTVMLEEQVRRRTAQLEAALRENEKINRALRESETKFRGLVSQSLVGIAIIENDMFSYSNARFDDMFGYSAAEVRQLRPLDIASANDRPLVAESMRQRLSGEAERADYAFRALRKNGSVIDIEIHSSTMEIGGRLALISMVLDVSERSRAGRELLALQERLRDQATHDALTGLHNRRYLDDTLGRELIAARRDGYCVSMIMGDLDHFKAVNDQLGHATGDVVLTAFARVLRQQGRASDRLGRLGGDEFVVILPGGDCASAQALIERLRSAWAATRPQPVTFSVGIASSSGGDAVDVLARADVALYKDKALRRRPPLALADGAA